MTLSNIAPALYPPPRSPPHAPPSPCRPRQSHPPSSIPPAASRFTADPLSRGMFRVLAYHPSQATPGSTVVVTLGLTADTTDMLFLRLVIGSNALTTTVHHQPGGKWELRAVAPIDLQHPSMPTLPLAVQVLNKSGEILDSDTFGTFTYIHSATTARAFSLKRESSEELLDTRVHPMLRATTKAPASILTSPTQASSSLPLRPAGARPREPSRSHTTHQLKKPFIRSKHPALDDDTGTACRSTLRLVTPLESLTKDWDADELACGRRLVRFACVREGRTLAVSCARIAPGEYEPGDAVVSCIYRADTDGCCVTSVDVIALLEHLVGTHFDIEEKNRIRRNLEGFRPKTVSKTRLDSNDFFALIMNFPPPKPRNIEKDLKVFDWSVLPQALEKIIARLPLSSAAPESPPTPAPSSASPSPPSFLSPAPDLPYPPSPDECVSPASLMGPPFLRTPEYSRALFPDAPGAFAACDAYAGPAFDPFFPHGLAAFALAPPAPALDAPALDAGALALMGASAAYM